MTAETVYLVPEYKLRELLQDSNKLAALECGGVDNWESYGWSIGDFVEDFINNHTDFVKEYSGIDDFDIDGIAEFDMLNYSTVADLYEKTVELFQTL